MNLRLKLQQQSIGCFKGDDSMNRLNSKGTEYLRSNFKLDFLVLNVSNIVSLNFAAVLLS